MTSSSTGSATDRAGCALAILCVGVGALTLSAGTLLLLLAWAYALPISLPLIALGAFWMSCGTRIEDGRPPSWLSRVLGFLACLVLLMFWRFLIVAPLIVALEREMYGQPPPPSDYGDIRLLGALTAAAALSVMACLTGRSRSVRVVAPPASRARIR